MKENFSKAYSFLGSWEGFISNDPDDSGGYTYRGISRQYHPDWEGWQYVDAKEYDKADALVPPFYKSEYWDKAGCEKLPDRIDVIVFDAAVNQGISFAKTIANHADYRDCIFARITRYNESAKKGNNIKFLRGWLNRVMALYKILRNGG